MIAIIGSDGKIKKLWVSSGLIEIEPGNFVPDTATITINGDEQLLVDNPVFSISTSIPDGDYGDITISGSGTVMTINSGVITTAMFDASAIAPKAAELDPGSEINGIAFDGSADIMVVESLNAYKAMGSSIKASSLGGVLTSVSTTITLGNQQARFLWAWLPKTETLNGIMWYQGTQGNYTANNYNGVGIYSYSGGTLTLEASSTDDGDIWKATANGWHTKDFTTPFAAPAGLYFISLLYCRSAEVQAPIIGCYRAGNANAQLLDFTNSAKAASILASQTSLPTPQLMSGLSINSAQIALGIY